MFQSDFEPVEREPYDGERMKRGLLVMATVVIGMGALLWAIGVPVP